MGREWWKLWLILYILNMLEVIRILNGDLKIQWQWRVIAKSCCVKQCVSIKYNSISSWLAWQWANDITIHWRNINKDAATKTTRIIRLRSIVSLIITMLMLRVDIWGEGNTNFAITTWMIWNCTSIYFIWIRVHKIVLLVENVVLIGFVVYEVFTCIGMQNVGQRSAKLAVLQILTMDHWYVT